MNISNQITNIFAILLLIFMGGLAIYGIANSSLTMDELAHLPAGYSYLIQKDMRLNPEHPPLVKDLAALPLLFIKNISFPSEIKSWKEDINGQWDFGNKFLFWSNNPADEMIFKARIMMIFLLLTLGFFIFKASREFFGNKVALLALFLFSFSPTFLAHGPLVTTDVGASLGVFIATYYFVKYLINPSKNSLIISGISLGIANLLKFSTILLFPFFGILIFVFSIIKSQNIKDFLKLFILKTVSFILIIIIAFFIIWLVYLYHTLNYPPERQAKDAQFLLQSTPFPFMREFIVQSTGNIFLRPLAQYFLGLTMVFERAKGGHTMFFLGEISAAGWKNYFPFVYIVKEPLAMHILTIIAIFAAILAIKKPFWQNTFLRIKNWINNHLFEFAMLVFIGIYWITSLTSNLNLGVRHLLPIFPFVYVLTSIKIIDILKPPYIRIKYLCLSILLIWQAITVITISPHFLSYFNEIIGGPQKGYLYTVDSNLDWGQDLKRLKDWVDEKGIEKIYIDYFGGADTKYYFKEKFEPWWGTKDQKELPKGSYLAVSVSHLQGGRGLPAKGFNQPTGYYLWLNKYEPPIDKIGYSIFIYYIN